jgi:two-component system, sensor histidine kinase YesM
MNGRDVFSRLWSKLLFVFNSLRFKLMFGLLVVMLPVSALLIYNNYYSMEVVRNQVAQSNSNLISLYMGQIDRNLEEIDKYLLELVAADTSLLAMERSSALEIDQYQLAKLSLFNTLSDGSANMKVLDYFFSYSSDHGDFMLVPRDGRESFAAYREKQQIIASMTKTLLEPGSTERSAPGKWTDAEISGEHYLLRVLKSGNVYLGALINAKHLMVPLSFLDIGEQGQSFLVNGAHEPITDIELAEEEPIALRFENNAYRLEGNDLQYLVVGERSEKGNFSLIALIPESSILEKLPYLQRIILFIMWGLALYLAVALPRCES